MSERTKLLKKALLTSVGASTNGERIKAALSEAFDDLAKIGQDLLSELEGKGKDQTKSAQKFLEKLKSETERRSKVFGKDVSKQVHKSVEKTAKEFGLVTRKEMISLSERISRLEKRLANGSSHRKDRKPKSSS
jgi:polyhydroxyalkanoate synthesis regulator phasin